MRWLPGELEESWLKEADGELFVTGSKWPSMLFAIDCGGPLPKGDPEATCGDWLNPKEDRPLNLCWLELVQGEPVEVFLPLG